MKPKLSVVMPVLNEARRLADSLHALQPLRADCELLVVDGGSEDGSQTIANALAERVLSAPCGRAKQMNIGAAEARSDILLFLHADTSLPESAVESIVKAVESGASWGRFDVRFDSKQAIFGLIAFMMNRRSRLTGIATGDQALFVTRATFEAVGGFPDIALMEDVAICDRLRKLGKPRCLSEKVTTSPRRWQHNGVLKTILLMWRLRLAYFFGADPNQLAARYYRRP